VLGWHRAQGRNYQTYAAFGFLLMIAGSRILLSGAAASSVWGALAIVFLTLRGTTPHWHGGLYLLAGLLLSGALAYGGTLLLGNGAGHGLPSSVVWPGTASLVCYALATTQKLTEPLLRKVLAATAFWILGSLTAGTVVLAYYALFGSAAPHAYCATLRTVVLAGGALLFAWSAARWNLMELRWVGCLAMCLGAYRLLAVDLGQDRKPALVFSLLCYGASLMLLPRLLAASHHSAKR
jgi:hypothetical protein